MLDNESNELGSKSGSSGTYYFRYFSLHDEESIAGVFASDVFAPTGVESLVGQLFSMFSRSNCSLEFSIQI